MREQTYIRLLLTTLMLALAAGCSTQRISRELAATMAEQSPTEVHRIHDLLRSSSDLKSSRSLWRVNVDQRESRQSFRLAVVESDSVTRIDLFPLVGASSLGVGVLGPNSARYLDPTTHRAYLGSSSAGILRRAVGLPVAAEDFFALLARRAALPTADPAAYRAWCSADGARCALGWGNFQRIWWLEQGELSAVEQREVASERLIFRANYRGEDLDLELPKWEVRAGFQKVFSKVVEELPKKLFELPIPGSYTLIKLEDE